MVLEIATKRIHMLSLIFWGVTYDLDQFLYYTDFSIVLLIHKIIKHVFWNMLVE